MSETLIYSLIALNLVIIAGLGIYVYRLLKAEKIKREEAQAKADRFAQELADRRLHIIESLRVIGQAVLNEEIPLTEASIRCKVLLDNLDPQLAGNETYSVFNAVYEESKHIPRLEAWKALKGPEKLKFMNEMEALEARYTADIQSAARALTKENFNRYH